MSEPFETTSAAFLADASGQSPAMSNILVIGSGALNPGHAYTELWMPDGQVIRIPTATLAPPAAPLGAEAVSAALGSGELSAVMIPLIEERLEVSKRVVATGKVRLRKSVQTYEEALDEPLAINTFDVERVVLNRPIEVAPPVRKEGDTTIYPLVEEQLVLTKQLILKEEVRVTRRETERRDTRTVTLHREHLTVEREALEAQHTGNEPALGLDARER